MSQPEPSKTILAGTDIYVQTEINYEKPFRNFFFLFD